jgi:hypothetical protein
MLRFISCFFIVSAFSFCNRRYYTNRDNYHFNIAIQQYDDLNNWAAHPQKWDPSDSIPEPLRKDTRDTAADVFFIHPTTYTKDKKGWNADLSDAAINVKTDYSTILYQASVFNQHCRIFAPRYRQAHFSAFFTDAIEAQAAFDTAYADVRTAFLYYLEHYNIDRPIIIAGHSQGAKMAAMLLKEFFDGESPQLVAAYVFGWPVPKNYFEKLPVCDSPGQTGCFITWRTYRRGYVPEYIKQENPRSYVVNPLNWKTDSTYAFKQLNKGSVLRSFNKVIRRTTDAQIHDDVLWVNKPKFPGAVFFTTNNYHIGDVNLFYVNIRENVELRINEFLKKDRNQ